MYPPHGFVTQPTTNIHCLSFPFSSPVPNPSCIVKSQHGLHLEMNGRLDFEPVMVPSKWLVMPEGLTNAPAAFQRFMSDIIVIINLDDILIYSDNISKHKAHILEILCTLCINENFAYADKCEFHVTSHKYLRYMLSPKGLTMAPYKVQIIQDCPIQRK